MWTTWHFHLNRPPPPIADTYSMFGVTINNDDAIIQSLESQVTLRYCTTFKDESISVVGSNYDLWTNLLLALRCRVSKGSTLRKISTERKSCGSWTIPSSSTSSTSLTSWSSVRSPPGGRRRLKRGNEVQLLSRGDGLLWFSCGKVDKGIPQAFRYLC